LYGSNRSEFTLNCAIGPPVRDRARLAGRDDRSPAGDSSGGNGRPGTVFPGVRDPALPRLTTPRPLNAPGHTGPGGGAFSTTGRERTSVPCSRCGGGPWSGAASMEGTDVWGVGSFHRTRLPSAWPACGSAAPDSSGRLVPSRAGRPRSVPGSRGARGESGATVDYARRQLQMHCHPAGEAGRNPALTRSRRSHTQPRAM